MLPLNSNSETQWCTLSDYNRIATAAVVAATIAIVIVTAVSTSVGRPGAMGALLQLAPTAK